MCAHLLSKERRCRWRAPGGASGAHGVTAVASTLVRVRSGRAGTVRPNTPSPGLPSRPGGGSSQQAPVTRMARPSRPHQPRPDGEPESLGRRQRGKPASEVEASPNAMRDENGTLSASRRTTPSATSPNERRASPRARSALASATATESRCQSAAARPPAASQLEQGDRAQAARSRASGGASRQSLTVAVGRLKPAVGPMDRIQRVGQEQAVEVRDIPANRRH